MDLPAPDVEGYKGDNTSACYQQLLQVIAASSGGRGRQQTDPACVCLRNCIQGRRRVLPGHNSTPEPLEDMSAELNKQAAARHPGLCGHPHAWGIAAVKTQDVETKWASTNGNKHRNQGRLYFYLHCMRAT